MRRPGDDVPMLTPGKVAASAPSGCGSEKPASRGLVAVNWQALLCRLGPLLVMAAIFLTSSLSGVAPDGLLSRVPSALHDPLHIPAYALLAAALCLALPRQRGWRTVLLVAMLTLGYGLFDEWHQSFVPGRQVSVADLGRDALGCALGLWLTRRLWSVRAIAPVPLRVRGDC